VVSAEAAWLNAGARAWPQIRSDAIDVHAMLRSYPKVLARRPNDVSELWLALACVAGDTSAMRAFESRYLDAVDRTLRSRGLDADARAEVLQRVRVRLFVARRDGAPVILHCAGRGRLGGLVHVTAIREAARLLSATRPSTLTPATLGEAELDLRGLDHHADALAKAAFERAAARLERRDRTLLRLHYAREVSAARIARMYGVHRATAARWLESARLRLLQGLCRELRTLAPHLRGADVRRFETWFHTNVELSLSRLFRTAA
jgi:RNA polymerase sigma-70 factor (ECF subfamily)